VIQWMDFVFDDVLGPMLSEPTGVPADIASCRSRSKGVGSLSVMQDALSKIQETGQVQRPARMVGFTGFDSNESPDMDVGRTSQTSQARRGGGKTQ
jgi:hypothetical protein